MLALSGLLLLGTTTGHFLLSGWRNGMEVIAPLTNEEVGGVAGHPDQCPLVVLVVQRPQWYC